MLLAIGDRIEVVRARFYRRHGKPGILLNGRRGMVERVVDMTDARPFLVDLDDDFGAFWFEPQEIRKLSLLELIAEAAA